MTQKTNVWPEEIRLNSEKNELRVAFEGGRKFDYEAEFLRVMSPSAEVQGHSPDQRVTVPGKQDVLISALEPVGNYAVRITFDDGHSTGLYSWDYLHELGVTHHTRWGEYLDELKAKGLSRTR